MQYLKHFLLVFLFINDSLSQENNVSNNVNKSIYQELVDNVPNEYDDIRFNSIMHTKEEINKINKAFKMFKQGEEYVIEDEKNEVRKTEEEKLSEELRIIQKKSKIYLGSILYLSNKNWSVWINDKLISADNNNPINEIYIRKIDGKKALIIWSLSPSKWQVLMGKNLEENDSRINKNNMINISFTLQNNQSYLLKENKIIVGRGEVKEKTNP